MSLVGNVQNAFIRVATEVNALKSTNSTLAQALIDLNTAIEALEQRPHIIVSSTEPLNPTEGMIWLDTSGTPP